MYHRLDYRWTATYKTERGTPYEIDDTDAPECPVSYVSPAVAELAGALEMARRAREATGENPLPPVKRWPVRLLDAARLIHIEGIREHNARIEAEARERE